MPHLNAGGGLAGLALVFDAARRSTARLFRPAGLRSQVSDLRVEPPAGEDPVASLRLSFPSAYLNLARFCCRLPAGNSSRFGVWLRPCGFWRHSSSRAADVLRARDRGSVHRSCATGLFLGGVPLPWPKAWSSPVHPLALIRPSRTGNAHGIFNPSQPWSCPHVDRRSSRRHTPHAVS